MSNEKEPGRYQRKETAAEPKYEHLAPMVQKKTPAPAKRKYTKRAPEKQEIAAEKAETVESAPVVGRRSQEDSRQGDARGVFNHALEKEREISIGGMDFRRGRAGMDHSNRLALDVPAELMHPDLDYFWTSDHKGLVEKRKDLGYAIVDRASFSKGGEFPTTKRVGTQKDGSALNAILMATPKDWRKDRQNAKEQERLEKEKRMFQRPVGDDGQQLGGDFYNKASSLQVK